MQTRTVVLAAAFSAGMALVPISAKAVCTQVFYAQRGFSDGTTAQILGRVNAIDTFAFFANTTNAQLANLIFAAVAHHNRVVVIGDAGSCPTTGNERFMGNVVQIFQEP
jgi:hypothetical protein